MAWEELNRKNDWSLTQYVQKEKKKTIDGAQERQLVGDYPRKQALKNWSRVHLIRRCVQVSDASCVEQVPFFFRGL